MSVIKQINYNEHLKVLLGPQNHAKLPAIQVVKAQRKRPRVTRFAKPESAGGAFEIMASTPLPQQIIPQFDRSLSHQHIDLVMLKLMIS